VGDNGSSSNTLGVAAAAAAVAMDWGRRAWGDLPRRFDSLLLIAANDTTGAVMLGLEDSCPLVVAVSCVDEDDNEAFEVDA
jgi:hypothetical protein